MRRASFAVLALVMLVSLLGTSNLLAYADEPQESSERKFLPYAIYNSFEVSEPYVSFGENNHVTVDVESMKINEIPDLDIEIMTKWTKHLNELLTAVASDNQTAVTKALDNAKAGQFSLITNPPNIDDSDAWVGGSHIRLHDGGIACGVTYADKKTWQGAPAASYPYVKYSSQKALERVVEGDGYVLIWIITSHHWRDFQKTNPIGMGGCTGGEFRDQRVIYEGSLGNSNPLLRTGWYVHQHENEPNPQVLHYSWPTVWWPFHVGAWHDLY
ncbi:MAG: hypothetical protein EB829_04615 [Nitrosopumilus sp. H8]|nr:MAG: hypothetical protein EB829_04615 [Nitrosopumilus sp. H8]